MKYGMKITSMKANYNGSAPAMEKAAAEVLWKRFVEKNKLRYTILLGGGDTKTFDHLNNIKVYGEDTIIKKEECINHVSKRMGTALRTLKKNSSKTGTTLGGRAQGSLTDTLTKLTGYYGKAVRNNCDNVDNMQQAIDATRLHYMSTDSEHATRQMPHW